jgi:hypothetical protein
MNTPQKIAGAFAAVLAVIALGGSLQAAVAASTAPNAAIEARTLSHGQSNSVVVHCSTHGERSHTASVAA